VDTGLNTTFMNPAAARMLGWKTEELVGRPLHAIMHHTRPDGHPYPSTECPTYRALKGGTQIQVDDEVFWRKDGTSFEVDYTTTPLWEEDAIAGAVVVFTDITSRKQAEREAQKNYTEMKALNRKLEDAHSQLLQSEKMASIGQLAAGVAHEINNPIGYVHSNLGSLDKYIRALLGIVDAYGKAEASITDGEALSRVRTAKQEADLEFLREDVNALLSESQEGITRVKKIVQDLKDFSHVDEAEWQWANLHHGLDATLNIVWNELKYKAEVIKEYGSLIEIECFPSQLNQVFMNLLVNAGHAIEAGGTITIRTGAEAEQVWVEIADSGKGIAPEHLTRIFEPFFTTKPVGKGTGLGLSLSYGIVEKHHGRIEVESEIGKGTTFRVWLPIKHADA
jgi:PAS domain S-box-containing protein